MARRVGDHLRDAEQQHEAAHHRGEQGRGEAGEDSAQDRETGGEMAAPVAQAQKSGAGIQPGTIAAVKST